MDEGAIRTIAAELDRLSEELGHLKREVVMLKTAIEELSDFPPVDLDKKTITGGIGTDPPTTIEVVVPGDWTWDVPPELMRFDDNVDPISEGS